MMEKEIEDWIRRAEEEGIKVQMRAACTYCSLPLMLRPPDSASIGTHVPNEGGCQCEENVIPMEVVLKAFGVDFSESRRLDPSIPDRID